MSRSRNIKPGFFKNELLAECSPLARLLFAGLWCVADREGRLEDRPKRLKIECLPYDDCDIDALLNELASRGFIVRYVVEGAGFIAIPEFLKHQRPHMKEAASTIPAPNEHQPRQVQEPEIPERAALIPDSLNPHPDSNNNPSDCLSSADDCPHAEILRLYHEILPANPRMKVWNGQRAKHLRARWREEPKRQSLDYWRRFFEKCAASRFLTGQTVGKDGRAFLPGLDWLILPTNFAKVIEGRYDD